MTESTVDFTGAAAGAFETTKANDTSMPAVAEPAEPIAAGQPSVHADHLVEALVQLWRELLANQDCNADTNIFLSGGTSLHAALVVGRVKTLLDIRIGIGDVFQAPTPAKLAARIVSVQPASVAGG